MCWILCQPVPRQQFGITAGASSIVLAARRVANLENVAASIRTSLLADSQRACNVACIPMDVANLDSIRAGVSQAEHLAGSVIDVCINCAGIAAPVHALEIDEDQVRI